MGSVPHPSRFVPDSPASQDFCSRAASLERTVVAYAGNVSVVQTVALAFPLSPSEMATWQERFATTLQETGADAVDVNGDDEVEAENVPASPKPAQRVTCSTGEHDGQEGVVCTSVFINF